MGFFSRVENNMSGARVGRQNSIQKESIHAEFVHVSSRMEKKINGNEHVPPIDVSRVG
jgi:hypothetical protein